MSSYMNDPLYQQVVQQVNEELASQTLPYQQQIQNLAGQEQATLGKIGEMFSGLQPYVSGAAEQVQANYNAGLQAQQSIYQAANQRLADMRAQRAADAQRMAQQTGGPVAVGEFTQGVDPAQQYYIQSGAGELLHALGGAQAGVQQAQAFAGQVFPLLRTEQEADARSSFAKQRTELQQQIDQLRTQRSSTISQRFFDRQQQERQYQLDKANLELDKIKSNRDWKATLKSLKLDAARVQLAKDEGKRAAKTLKMQQTESTAGIKQKNKELKQRDQEITNQVKQFTAGQKLEAKKLGLSERELAAKIWDMHNRGKITAQSKVDEQRKLAMELIDQATNPSEDKTVSQTVTTEVDRTTALLNKKAYGIKGADGQMHYYLDRSVAIPASQVPPVQDPQKLYNMLIGYGTPAKMAEKLVEAKLNAPTFQPGKLDYSKQEMQQMGFSQLRGVAMQMGFKPQGTSTRKQLIRYVSSRLARNRK